jgi:hypothetical protein
MVPVADTADVPARATGLPSDAGAAWQAVAATLEGLAADFAAEAHGASWRDDQLEIALPAQAATAAAFLRRPEQAAAIGRALESLAGRHVRHAIVLADAPVAAAAAEPTRPAAAPSQAALVRGLAEHPFVAHARTVFDAAIRKVEPPRPREQRPVVTATVPEGAATAGSDDADHGDSEGTDG